MENQNSQLKLIREYIIFEINKTIQSAPTEEAFNRLDLVRKILMKLNANQPAQPAEKGAC